MELTPSQIRYLLAVYMLNKNGVVRSVDIAKKLHVTRPSAHRMITQMSGMGLLEKERYSSVKITESGSHLAKQYQACFSCICGLLNKRLNIPCLSSEEGVLVILSKLDLSKLELTSMQIQSGEVCI
ncbi:MAG: MarR family transcriptional regulator [Lachnospiraceae bacterium]|nr:MarR family transcriptional regulator [Lachnospiraceae bacterium]